MPSRPDLCSYLSFISQFVKFRDVVIYIQPAGWRERECDVVDPTLIGGHETCAEGLALG